MRTRNNNREVIRELAGAYGTQNRRQNRILITAAAMSVFLLYAAFAIAYGKIRSDYLIDVRGMGTVATVSLERGSQTQYEQMRQLSYLEDVGVKKTAGTGTYEDSWAGNLVYLDDTAYEKLMVPAYTDVVGTYPRKENEVMLSAASLEQMGISRPEPGMEIDLTAVLENGTEDSISFLLSGYYTDYIDFSVAEPEAYVSGQFLEAYDIPVFPADKVMAASGMGQAAVDVERNLYADLTMEEEAQQVFSENPMAKQSVEGVFGSVSIAAGCGILVVLCAFMLIFNVISITMGRNIRQYGMLKVLGTTDIQLKGIVFRQNFRNIGMGILLGAGAGAAAVRMFLPFVLQKLFMEGLGKSDVAGFYPLFLLGASFLSFLTAFFASGLAFRRVKRWNAMDSVRYTETGSICKRKRRSSERFLLPGLAWRNITRSGKRLLISCISLLTGCVTALGAAVIVTGTDLTNRIEQNPDFQIGILTGIFRFPELVPEKVNDGTPVLSAEMLETIGQMDEIDQDTVEMAEGSYAVIDFRRDEVLQPRRKSLDDPSGELAFATLQVVDDSFVSALEVYIKENQLPVNLDSFKTGEGCILLHHNELSRELESQAERVQGMPVTFYSLDAYGDEEKNAPVYEKGSLVCAGYLDMTEKYFPDLPMTSIGNNINYFIMTENAFQKLGFPGKVFDISFDVKEGQEDAIVNQKLVRLVQKENQNAGMMDTYYLNANYTLLEAEQNRIQASNRILGGLSAVILVIGIMNYGNTLWAGMSVRRKELAVMESLGLTKDQRWKMIFLEGMGYWMIVMAAVVTAGSGFLWLLGKAVAARLQYFRFVYPWQILLILAAVLIGVCVVFTGISCRGKDNLAEELRKDDD